MASTLNLFILVALTITAMASPFLAEARWLASTPASANDLAVRLKLEGEPSNCWDSLFQLQACSGEVVTFFLNGETYLGHGCCVAIMRVIGQDCWPNIIGSLGFTTEEGDILEGYCDEAVQNSPPSSLEPKVLVP